MEALIETLAAELAGAEPLAVVLVGSAARGEADAHSDVDVHVVVAGERPPDWTAYRGGRLVTVNFVDTMNREAMFSDPRSALWNIRAAQTARILYDPQGWYADLQRRALAFQWASVAGVAALRVSAHLAGTAEEVGKVLGGFAAHDLERALYASHGLLWSLTEASALANGVLLDSENRYFSTIRAAEPDGRWGELLWQLIGFGGEGPSARAEASVRLYLRSVELYGAHLTPRDRANTEQAAEMVRRAL